MSSYDRKVVTLRDYNLAAGMDPDQAVRSARMRLAVGDAMSLSLAAFIVAFGSFMFVLFGPVSESTTASQRLASIGLLMIVGLIGLAFFPIRAKNVCVWICYGMIMALAAIIALLGTLL
jgi:hypothetical protein